MNKKVVVLGGGCGLSTLLKGLKQFPIDISAIVSVCDDGKSTGRLREEFNQVAVGDIRRVLVALSETEHTIDEILNYRFNTTSDLNGHTVGNLLLTAASNIKGNLSKGIKSLAKIHSKNIIHANINPENIFVINEDSIKIGDFSSAKDIELKFKKTINKYSKVSLSQSYQNLMELSTNDEIETNHIEESLYSSPEQNKGTVVSKKSDVYSVGLVLYEMCECFPDEDKRNKGIKLLKKNKTFEEKFKKEYELQCKLILKMIEDDEDKRPSCEELLKSSEMQNWKFSLNEN